MTKSVEAPPAGAHGAQPAATHLVHEAVGPPLPALQAAAAIGVGVNSLLFAGVLPG